MTNKFNFRIDTDSIIFNNVIVQNAILNTPIAYREGEAKKFVLRFFIPKNDSNTKRLFSEIAKMYDITESQLIRETKITQRSIKEASLLSTDDQQFKSILEDHYVVSSTAMENVKIDIFDQSGVNGIVIQPHDRVRAMLKIKTYFNKKDKVKQVVFQIQKVLLLEASNEKNSVSEEFSNLFHNGDFDSESTNNNFNEIEV